MKMVTIEQKLHKIGPFFNILIVHGLDWMHQLVESVMYTGVTLLQFVLYHNKHTKFMKLLKFGREPNSILSASAAQGT